MIAAGCAGVELLLARRATGGLDEGAAAELDRHLANCAACRAVALTQPPGDEDDEVGPAPALLGAGGASPYALGDEVARGGMGRILRARDVRIGREVAIKELVHRSPALASRFAREARLTARLQHPGIVPIYEIGTWPDGTPFYAMRMVTGKTLREAIAARATAGERLTLLPSVITACDAVAFAHAQGVVHRDLSPSNVLVGDHGETVVIDWGLAKDLDGDPADEPIAGPYRASEGEVPLTAVGTVFGTAAYMAPEQAQGAAVDRRADVYSLGAMLHHLLTGRAPYQGSSEQILAAVRAGVPPAAITDDAVVPELRSIVAKAMATAPGARYADAGELAAELRRFEGGRLVAAHSYTARERVWRWARHYRVAVTGLLALVVAGAIGLAGVVRERDRAEAGQRAAEAGRHEAEVGRREAERQRTVAGNALRALYAELGTQAFAKGDSWTAAAWLTAAAPTGDEDEGLRFLLARAMTSIDAIERVIDLEQLPDPDLHAGKIEGLAFDASGERLLITTRALVEQIQLRDGAHLAHTLLPVDRLDDVGVHFVDAWFADDGSVNVLGTGFALTADRTSGQVVGTLDPDAARDELRARRAPAAPRVITRIRAGATTALRGSIDGARRTSLACDQRILIVEVRRGLEVWDLHEGYRVALLPAFGLPAVDPAHCRIAAIRRDHVVIIVNLARLLPQRIAAADHGGARVVAVSDDLMTVLAAGTDGGLRLWTDGAARTLALSEPAALAVRGERLAGWRGDAVVAEPVAGGAPLALIAQARAPRTVALDERGAHLLVVSADGHASLTDLSTQATTDLGEVTDAVLEPIDGFVVACRRAGPGFWYEPGAGAPRDLVLPCARAIARVRDLIATAGHDGRFQLADRSGHQEPSSVSAGTAAFDRHALRMAMAADDGVYWWSPLTQLHGFRAHRASNARVVSAGFPDAPPSSLLAARARGLMVPQTAFFTEGPVELVAVHPDGVILATEQGVGFDGPPFSAPWPTEGPHRPVALRFSGDGARLIMVDAAGDVLAWDVRAERRPPAAVDAVVRVRTGLAVVDGQLTSLRPMN